MELLHHISSQQQDITGLQNMLNNEQTKYQAFAFATPNQPITRPTKRTGEALNPKVKHLRTFPIAPTMYWAFGYW
jgi:hypothetical protein